MPRNTIETRLNRMGAYQQHQPIKYQPTTTFPDITELIYAIKIPIRTNLSFYLKTQKLLNQSKITQTKSIDHRLPLLD